MAEEKTKKAIAVGDKVEVFFENLAEGEALVRLIVREAKSSNCLLEVDSYMMAAKHKYAQIETISGYRIWKERGFIEMTEEEIREGSKENPETAKKMEHFVEMMGIGLP